MAGLQLIDIIKLLADPLDTVVVLTDTNFDQDGPTILYANPAYEKLTGYTPAEAIGKTPRVLQGSRTNHIALKKFTRALADGQPAQTKVINYRKNGEAYNCDIAAWPVLDNAGQPTHFIALEREFTRKVGRPKQTTEEQPWWLQQIVDCAQ